MNWPWLIGLAFALGTLFQGIVLVSRKIGFLNLVKQLKFIFIVVALGVAFFVIGNDKYVSEIDVYLGSIATTMMFGLFFVGIYAKEIQESINEKTIVHFNIIFLFVTFFILRGNPLLQIFNIIASIISIIILIIFIKNKNLDNKAKIATYIWFLIMNLMVAYNLWPDYTLYAGLSDWHSLFMMFLIGAMFFMIMYYCLFIVMNLQFKEFRQTSLSKIETKKVSIKYVLILLIIQGGILILNQIFEIVPEYALIDISFLMVFYLSSKNQIPIKF